MPGKPAARLGDTAMNCADPMDTPTGTVVAAGTVFINGMPAAKQGDQIVGVDMHIVNIPSPAGAVPTPLPHPFAGIIDGGLVSTVKIMGMPAAVVGSTATNTPPHIPQGGPFQKPPANKAQIMVGSPNVFIGSGSGGGGGGSSGSVNVSLADIFGAEPEKTDTKFGEAQGHFLDASLVDSNQRLILGTPYTLVDTEKKSWEGAFSGAVRRYGIPEGMGDLKIHAITRAAWSVGDKLEPGVEVGLQIETLGIEDGSPVRYVIWERDANRKDKFVTQIATEKVQGSKAEAKWVYRLSDNISAAGEGYSRPDYYFTAEVNSIETRSNILAAVADLTIQVFLDEEGGDPLINEPYRLFTSTGLIEEGWTDGSGWIKHEGLPPRKATIYFPRLHLVLSGSQEYVLPDDPVDEKLSQVVIHIEVEHGSQDMDLLDDKYRLFSTDGAYDETLSALDDRVSRSSSVYLTYYNVDPKLRYSLEVVPGSGEEKYLLLENVPFELLETE